MLKTVCCGLFFLAILLNCFSPAFAKENSSQDLERIIVTKNKIHLIQPYSLEYGAMENLAFGSPIEALSILPLDLQSRSLKGGIQTDLSLRGSTFQGVSMLFNGQRINDPQTGHHNSDIPITKEDLERIEVIPGASSSLFGPDAIGGAVNFIIKKPEEKKIVLESTGGQYRSWSELFSISDKIANLGARFSIENQESAGFREDTDFKKFTSSLNSSLDIPDGEFNLNFGYQEKEFGAYDFYTPASGYPSKEWTKTFLLDTGLILQRATLTIKPNFLWRRHYDKFALDKTEVRSRYLNHHRTDIYTPNIYLQKETAYFGRFGLGLEYGQEQINSTNLGKHSRAHKSIFLDDALDLTDKFSFGLSFRRDDFDGFEEVYTGSINLRYSFVNRNYLHFGVSRSMRIPSFTELYYNDPTTLGNTALSAEKSLNYEVGYDYKTEKLFLGVTFFLRQEKDFMDWVKRTSTQAKWQIENITAADVFGLEERLKIELNQNLDLESNYTYTNKRIDEQGLIYKYGSNYARHLFNTELLFKLPFGTQSIGFTYKKKPDRDGWFLLNSRISYVLNKNFQVFLKATNLLNVEYQEIEGIPQPGRWIEAGVKSEW